MRRWLLVIGLAVVVAAVGLVLIGKHGGVREPAVDEKSVITEQREPENPGPGGRTVKKQAKEIADAVKKDLQSKRSWDATSVQKYRDAVEDALVEWVQSSSGLTEKEKEHLIESFPAFIDSSLPRSVRADSVVNYVNAAKYGVKMYAGRKPVNKATQDRIDAQIDSFADYLKPALIRIFKEYSTSEEKLTQTAEDIRKGLKACSRNPWFPALKEPLDSDEESGIRAQIVEQTLITQLENFKKAKAEGKQVRFDWGDTSAWSAATKLVSKTIKPPSDRMIMFSHSPGMPGIGVQVKPPMMAPKPTGGGMPAPGAPPSPPAPPSPG
ncbi:hypothetical protein AMK68_04755 [candidate division KD3-62 bacterium DG_56]|uniref:Uncharacterized protein n=1 Tax=candidate division KD3-62 bacterium DG_56 TaxID=1704032 RepID=A0A0S7XJB3_9BACT|nr:MAG: hypothetical protein AMK68_04755 [candidate division KD3-62 bacterium DG_56]